MNNCSSDFGVLQYTYAFGQAQKQKCYSWKKDWIYLNSWKHGIQLYYIESACH